jgi:hypothetical protein
MIATTRTRLVGAASRNFTCHSCRALVAASPIPGESCALVIEASLP